MVTYKSFKFVNIFNLVILLTKHYKNDDVAKSYHTYQLIQILSLITFYLCGKKKSWMTLLKIYLILYGIKKINSILLNILISVKFINITYNQRASSFEHTCRSYPSASTKMHDFCKWYCSIWRVSQRSIKLEVRDLKIRYKNIWFSPR